MQNEPDWVSADALIALNQIAVAETGERHLIRDIGLLESAAARPLNLWSYTDEHDLVTLAVALMFGIARNHPFEQGNKRTAFAAGDAFLRINGYRFAIDDPLAFADAMVAVITGEQDDNWFVDNYRHLVIDL